MDAHLHARPEGMGTHWVAMQSQVFQELNEHCLGHRLQMRILMHFLVPHHRTKSQIKSIHIMVCPNTYCPVQACIQCSVPV